jgi:1,4-alpha-glucan branching enzyme
VLAYHRWEFGGPRDDVVVIVNFANKLQNDYQINFPRTGVWHVRFNSEWKGYSTDFKGTQTDVVNVESDKGKLVLAPYSIVILSQD